MTATKPSLFAMLHAAHALEAELEAQLAGAGLSLARLSALRALDEAGDALPLGQLAERLSCVKSNITQLVDRLEADGLVERRPDPRDRRTRLAALTVRGRKAVREGARVVDAAEREALGRLTPDEALRVQTLLGKLGTVG